MRIRGHGRHGAPARVEAPPAPAARGRGAARSRRSRPAASSCAATTCWWSCRRAAPPTARACVALPKGHLDGDETDEQAAAREVREEGGVEADLVEPLGDVRYHYRRDGRLISKRVRFFLFAFRSGLARRPRPRDRGRALGAARAGRRPSSPTRASATWCAASCRKRARTDSLPRGAGPQLLLDGLRRPAQARPQDGDDPPRRQVAQVPQEPGGAGHDRLPVLAAREDLRRRDRPGRGDARCATSRRATSSTTTPSSAATRSSSSSSSRSTAARSRWTTPSRSCASRRSSRSPRT